MNCVYEKFVLYLGFFRNIYVCNQCLRPSDFYERRIEKYRDNPVLSSTEFKYFLDS